jgi:acyl-CoA synthetase (AMP-forming)/AMP-acid ligase II
LNVANSSEQGTIGKPTARVSYRIVSENGRDCRINEAGELRIHSPFAMLGYFGDKATTIAAFDEKQYFRTGDIARELNNGLVQLVGRKKEIISRGGIKISPVEVDSVFSKHPYVAAALCGGVPDARLGETLHILIVRRDGVKLEAQELMNWAAAKIEKTKLPNEIHFVDELPLGRTGKADRAGIKLIVRD